MENNIRHLCCIYTFRSGFVLSLLSVLVCFRRLNTLNKCASMKLDVNLPKKKVSVGFPCLTYNPIVLSCKSIPASSCT